MNSRLCFTDDDLARHLKEAWLLEIGSALNSDLPENWIALATRLGLKNETIDSLRHVPNPGYAVIRLWKTGPNATIRVLRNALVQMKRHDVIDLLQKAITDPTDVTIVIRYNDEMLHLAKGGVPGLTTLLEFVRPQIYCKFPHVLAKGVTCAHLSTGTNRSWTSALAEFRGQQIDIKLSSISQQRTHVKSAHELPKRKLVHFERNCQSYMLDELLFFEVPIPTTPPLPLETPRSSSPSSSLIEFDNRGPVQHPEDSQSEDISSSSVCQCPSHVQGENYFELPGYHPEIPTDDTRRRKVEDVLKDHLGKNGAYILRRTTQERSVFALSVVHNRKVTHFSIMRNVTGASRNYFVFSPNNFSSVSELMSYYHHHPLSVDAKDDDTRAPILTTPVL